jgi:protoporphyrinogen oxidase
LIDVVIVGAGFTGLSAAFELARKGFKVTVVEQEREPGGLAGSFLIGENRTLEKFYHHWFTSDQYIMNLVRELGREHDILWHASSTGMYHAHRIFRLSRPTDLLAFTPLSIMSRLRLGYMTLAARRVKNWRLLEGYTAKDWLLNHCGEQAYRIVWEPLLLGKFGEHAEEVSAVWLWNKLKLRGGSRGRSGQEVLAYYKGGFSALAAQIVADVTKNGGDIQLQTSALSVHAESGRIVGLVTSKGFVPARAVLLTVPLPLAANLVAHACTSDYIESLRRIRYLANICIVLELKRSLSSMYWLNVNDTSFPFVGIIEHTNFEPTTTYDGRHIVYLSKYLPSSGRLYNLPDCEAMGVAVDALRRMFSGFSGTDVIQFHVWRADYAQPIIERHYSRLIPTLETPITNLFLASMAQIYPEDRGTNYAVRDGRAAAGTIAHRLKYSSPTAASSAALVM